MSGPEDPVSAGPGSDDSAIDVTSQRPIAVHSCSRIGRVANPPGFPFSAWFRSGRRR